MKKIYIFLIALLCSAAVYGQTEESIVGARYKSDVRKDQGYVQTDIDMDLSHIKLGKQEMIVITPLIASNDGKELIRETPVIIAGSERYKFIKRSEYFKKTGMPSGEPKVIKYKKKKVKHIPYSALVTYQPWMRDASFGISEKLSGCSSCPEKLNVIHLNPDILPPAFVPSYRITYMVPPAEAVKQRSESFVARINYQVGKYELIRNFQNNAAELDRVDNIMRELVNDKDISITKFTVTGYASPEGNYSSNLTLSENRAKAFLDYLSRNFGANVSGIHYYGKGEDWDGLYKAVEKSYMEDRDRVLSTIRDTPDINKRKQALKSLSGGRTYKLLLADYYPPLRRNEAEISYVARAFDVGEARNIIHTRPQLLSLNEMFLVANSYPKDSEEFKEVFDIASRMFPDNVYAAQNNAALEIEHGLYDIAIENLKVYDNPEALNNLGVAYVYKKDYDKAEQYFRLAAAAGSQDGRHNLEQLLMFKDDNL